MFHANATYTHPNDDHIAQENPSIPTPLVR